jgi:hypothetical protein
MTLHGVYCVRRMRRRQARGMLLSLDMLHM